MPRQRQTQLHWVLYGPPGTGKTRALIKAVEKHLKTGAGRYALLCSHTKAAALTAVERWGKTTGRMDIQTLHSFCFKHMGLSRNQTVDDAKLDHFVEGFGLDMEEGGEGRQYLELISYAGNVEITPEEAYERSSRPGSFAHFSSFTKSYLDWKKEYGYVDFNDMLHRYAKGAKAATGHTLLAIDEAQDLTPLHWRVIATFMRLNPFCRVLVAGDDDQCIYGYTGALSDGPALFARSMEAGIRVLDQSYRVPRSVFDLSQQVVQRISKRVEKAYSPRDAEGAVVRADRGFESFTPGSASDILVLYGDRFVRKEVVEPVLNDLALPYTAVSGFPSPHQSKAGQAMVVAHKEFRTDDDVRTLRRGLTERGVQVLQTIGPDAVCKALRDRDLSLVTVHWSAEEYFNRVDWHSPVRIRISTIHGAKGMEAAQVHLLTGQSNAAVAYSFVDPDATHRLFYVGITRASESLTVYPGDNNYELSSPVW